MNLDEAVKIVREQMIPALRGLGSSGHVEALELLLAEVGNPTRQTAPPPEAKREAPAEGDGAHRPYKGIRDAYEPPRGWASADYVRGTGGGMSD